jgi:Leucine-rich repeat (LRR) protein
VLLVALQKIENAKKLGVLSLSEHGLESVPPDLFSPDLAKIRTLDLSKNSLSSVGNLGQLTELRSLNLDRNVLYAGSLDPLARLTKLQNLSLASNRLGRQAPSPPKADLTQKMQKMTVRAPSESLPALPASLKQINLSSNDFLTIPKQLCSAALVRLEKVDLSSNELAVVPPEIANLVNLHDLNLDHNAIASLPDEMGKLTKLKALSLRHNRLRVTSTVFNATTNRQPIPRALLVDTLLIDLNLHGNDMTNTQLNQFDGFQEFLDRRQKVKSKTLTNLDVCGLE